MTLLTAHPVFGYIHGFPLTAHGLFFAIGAEIGYLVMAKAARKKGLSTENLAEKVVLIFVVGLLCARIGFFLVYPSAFQSVTQVLEIWQGGLVSYFGMAGGVATAAFLFKKQRAQWLDILAIASLVAWAVGRIGNYYAGDSVGIISTYWSSFYGRVPIQLFESVYCAGLAIVGWRFLFTWKPGRLLAWTFMWYAVGRFIIDFWRDESHLGPLHVSQWASLIMILGAGIYFWKTSRAKI